jgi:hypothetical protein
MKRWISRLTLVLAAIAAGAFTTVASAQVTTGSIRGLVTDADNRPIEGARIVAVHTPSGTQYIGVTRADGKFNIPGMRIGGPYSVAATMIGFARQSRDDISVSLGVSSDLVFKMSAVATQLSQVTITSEGGELSSTRTGAATAVRREQLEQLPTISRRLSDFTRLTPQASGNSFAGQDNRLNNITVDGSYFNNSFGLGGQPGDRTNVAPISLDAIEAVQVNVAPFDVRQGAFTGAAVNSVTRSGTNTFSGSVYFNTRNNDNVGTRAGRGVVNPGTFNFDQIGFRLGGPIIKDKLFFFVSYESDQNDRPGTTFRANNGGETVAGNVTRVLKTDADSLSNFLRNRFGYETGPYQDYNFGTPSARLTAKVDYALSNRNKFSFRITQLESETDVGLSGSSSLGFGRGAPNSLGYANSNYSILENINSYVGEWNSLITDRMSNQMIIGFNKSDESRGAIDNLFPFVDILGGDIPGGGGQTYLSFGAEPFTPNNELRYESFQFQNNFTIYGDRHDLTFGLSVELYESENVFFPGKQSAYVYNSLTDFYADANAFITACGTNQANWGSCAAPATSAAGVGPRRFQVRYSNIQGQEKPVQPLEVNFSGFYVQDEWRVRSNLTVTSGLRIDVASFGATGFENSAVNGMNFSSGTGAVYAERYNTAALPKASPLFSPRVGFNYDLRGNGQTIIRGGTGVFTGRPAYVWVSNQIGNNGILTGFIQDDGVAGAELTNRPFNPNPDHYKPSSVNGSPAASYELALTDKNFKFPQVWRTNVALDHKFASGWRSTLELLWGQDVNGVYYINANLPAADAAFTGPDQRPRWVSDKCPTVTGTQTNRINCTVTSAVVLKNQNVGRTYNASLTLERAFTNGLYVKGATAYGTATNTVDAGSIAFGSWNNNQHAGNPNDPGLGNAAGFQGRRSFLVASYTKDLFGWGNTSISAFLENFTLGTSSYVFGGDLNGDGGTSNDLIYVPRDVSEMNFAPITGATPFSAAQQATAWNDYINQDPHLRNRRGQYALRGGVILPNVTRMDVSVSQDISRLVAGQKNSLQVRLDILNFTNMFNSDWGVSQRVINNQPLIPVAPLTTGPTAGQARYTMRVQSGRLLNSTFQKNAGINDVWRLQLGLRYSFN